MKYICEIKEFEKIINTSKEVICFVHSPWSGESHIGLRKYKELIEKEEEVKYLVIDNKNADSFIGEWLRNQKELRFLDKAWIHGKGELIKIVNGSLVEFQESIKE